MCVVGVCVTLIFPQSSDVSVSAVAQVMRNTSQGSRISRSSSPLVSLRFGKILPYISWKGRSV